MRFDSRSLWIPLSYNQLPANVFVAAFKRKHRTSRNLQEFYEIYEIYEVYTVGKDANGTRIRTAEGVGIGLRLSDE